MQDCWVADASATRDRKTSFLLGVFDGLGGHPNGRAASVAAAATLRQVRRELRPLPLMARLQAAVARTGGLTNAVVAAIRWDGVGWVAGVGDSAAFSLDRDGNVAAVTPIDSLGPSRLTRCLGAARWKPHVERLRLLPGRSLMLCTDGAYQVLPTPALRRLLTEENPGSALARCDQRHGLAGHDDATAVLIRRRQPG